MKNTSTFNPAAPANDGANIGNMDTPKNTGAGEVQGATHVVHVNARK